MASVTTLFCDSINRQENGKLNYIGIYNEFAGVLSFPFTFNNLSLVVQYNTPKDNPDPPTAIRVFLPNSDEIFHETVLTHEPYSNIPDDPTIRLYTTQAIHTFDDLVITSEGRIKVVVTTKSGQEIYAGSLLVKEVPPPSALQLPALLALASFPRRMSGYSEQQRRDAAELLLKSMDPYVPENVEAAFGDQSLQVQVSDNTFRVFTTTPLPINAPIEFEPPNLEPSVSERTPSGFLVKFASKAPVSEFSWKLKN